MVKGHLPPKIKMHVLFNTGLESLMWKSIQIREKEEKLALHMLSLYKQSPRKATEESQVMGVQQGGRTQC